MPGTLKNTSHMKFKLTSCLRRLRGETRIYLLLVMILSHTNGRAQIPGITSYQGRVTVSGAPFDGTGQFKFALVDPGVNTSRPAQAVATVTSGFITSIAVTDGGAGYLSAPAVTITGVTGSGASARATISGGVVTSITVQNAGANYSGVTVSLSPPPQSLQFVTYWSNDGTSFAGGEPTATVAVPVVNGLYTVLLGDSTLPNMTPVPTAALNHPDVRLRVWFNDGSHGFQLLAPDQRLAAAPYALLANAVSAGAITSAGIAPGAIGSSQLASSISLNGNVTVDNANLNAGTPSPGLIFGNSGNEAISSKRTAGGNQFGLDFYTAAQKRVSVTQSGNVGIGVAAPVEKLDIDGAAVFGNTANASPKAGTIRWTGSAFEGFDGTQWSSFSAASAVRSLTVAFSLAAGANSAPINVPRNVPVQVIGVTTTVGERGVGQATLFSPTDPPTFIEWTGVESPSIAGPVVTTSGYSDIAGTHILFLDYGNHVDIQVDSGTTIRIHNASTGLRTGSIKLIW
jgi:hypothetical protein